MADQSKVKAFLAATAIFGTLGTGAQGQGDVTDPVGYYISNIIGTEGTTDKVENLMTIGLVTPTASLGAIASIDGDEITLDGDFGWTSGQFNTPAGSHFVEMRSGAGQGLVFDITSSAGSTVGVETIPEGVLAPGDDLYIRKNQTLANLLGSDNEAGLLAGTNPSAVDNVILLEAKTQTQRVFYFHDDGLDLAEWRELGIAGDAGNTFIPFPTGLMIVRRAAEDLQLVIVGHVPFYRDTVPSIVSFLRVWPGQNLLSLPFNAATLDSSGLYSVGSPYSVIAGGDATEADALIVNDSYTTESFPPVYYRSGEGWRRVGEDGDAGAWEFPFVSATRYQRVGGPGWVRFLGDLDSGSGARTRRSPSRPINSVAGTTIAPAPRDEIKIQWPTENGTHYQIQRKDLGTAHGHWIDLPDIYTGDGATASVTQPAESNTGAYFRVNQLQGK